MKSGWLLVKNAVMLHLRREMSACGHRDEKGGILIGCYRGPHIEVTDFTERGPNDIATRYSFTKQDQKHQRAATSAWTRSQGIETYVGEWHTHPFGPPSPSSTDLTAWKEIASRENRPMYFTIVSPEGWTFYVAHARFWKASVKKLVEVELGKTGTVYAPGPSV